MSKIMKFKKHKIKNLITKIFFFIKNIMQNDLVILFEIIFFW
jgi:hypothetical protein